MRFKDTEFSIEDFSNPTIFDTVAASADRFYVDGNLLMTTDHIKPVGCMTKSLVGSTFLIDKQEYMIYNEIFEDFSGGNGQHWTGLGVTSVGAGASNVASTSTTFNVVANQNFGLWAINTGTTSTGFTMLTSSLSGCDLSQQALYDLTGRIAVESAITTGTQEHQIIFGMSDALTTDASTLHGLYFRRNVSSANWQVVIEDNAVKTVIVTGIPVSNTTMVTLRILYDNLNGTPTATFFINGNVVHSTSSGLPSTRRTRAFCYLIQKTVGTTSHVTIIDWFRFICSIPTRRRLL